MKTRNLGTKRGQYALKGYENPKFWVKKWSIYPTRGMKTTNLGVKRGQYTHRGMKITDLGSKRCQYAPDKIFWVYYFE